MAAFVSAEPFHPGEFLKDELDARGWTQEDIAEVTGISRRQIINLLQGKSGVTPDTAIKIAEAFEQDAVTWMHYQVTYELALAAQKDREVSRRAYVFDKVPVREIRRRGWIKDTQDVANLEAEVCRLLAIPSIKDSPELKVAALKSADYSFTSPQQMAWYCGVRAIAESAPAAAYREQNLEGGIAELLKLSEYAEGLRRVPAVLNEMGVRLVFVKHLQGTRSDGVAMWLDGQSPVVGMSLRFARIDNFWFTLLHELTHVKYKDESPVDEDICLPEAINEVSEIEVRASAEASNHLIPIDRLESFIARHSPLYYEKEVVRFAQSIRVHPGIVVGQLQRRGELTYKQLRKYLPMERSDLIGQALTDGWGNVLDLGD